MIQYKEEEGSTVSGIYVRFVSVILNEIFKVKFCTNYCNGRCVCRTTDVMSAANTAAANVRTKVVVDHLGKGSLPPPERSREESNWCRREEESNNNTPVTKSSKV